MRKRGQKYWQWSEADIHVRNHDERLSSGVFVNIQVRHSASAGTQLFVGLYGEKGVMIIEEIYESRPGETMTQAIEWGVGRAKKLAGDGPVTPIVAAKSLKLPRQGSRLFKP